MGVQRGPVLEVGGGAALAEEARGTTFVSVGGEIWPETSVDGYFFQAPVGFSALSNIRADKEKEKSFLCSCILLC